MKIASDKRLMDFEFWGGAKSLASALTYEELDQLELIIEDDYPDGIDDTTLNDIFAYEGDTIAEWLGLKSEEYILQRGEAGYLLSEARELLEQIREDNFAPEFTLEDTEVFRENTGMSAKQFAENGWRAYVASIEDVSIKEVVDDSGYEDTLEYIRLEVLDGEIAGTIQAFKDRTRNHDVFTPNGESMVSFRSKLTDVIDKTKSLLPSIDDERLADILVEDINKCNDLCTGEKLEEEEEEEPER